MVIIPGTGFTTLLFLYFFSKSSFCVSSYTNSCVCCIASLFCLSFALHISLGNPCKGWNTLYSSCIVSQSYGLSFEGCLPGLVFFLYMMLNPNSSLIILYSRLVLGWYGTYIDFEKSISSFVPVGLDSWYKTLHTVFSRYPFWINTVNK